jgi:hypothetical protein
MQRFVREISVFVWSAIFLLFGALSVARGDNYANGDKIRQPWAVNAGVRWQWGGKAEQEVAVAQPSVNQSTGKEEEPKVWNNQ